MRALHRMPTGPALLALALVALAASTALAHKVNVFAMVENGVITGEGYFGAGAKAQNVPVELRDASGAILATTATATDGTFSVPLPKGAAAPLTIVLKAGEGHQNDFTLTAQDLAAGTTGTAPAGQSSPASEEAMDRTRIGTPASGNPAQAQGSQAMTASLSGPGAGSSAPVVATPGQPGAAQTAPSLSGMDRDALAALVEAAAAKAVEQKIAPLRMELAKLASEDQSGRLRDIVGGLGWIVGLVGIAAWFKRPKG